MIDDRDFEVMQQPKVEPTPQQAYVVPAHATLVKTAPANISAPKKQTLNKIGTILLVISIILALAFIIPGAVVASGEFGSVSLDDDSSGITYKKLYLGSSTTGYSYEEYNYFKYTATSSGKIYVLIDNASLYKLRDEYNSSVSFKYTTSYDYEYAYSFYAEKGETYYFTLLTQDSYGSNYVTIKLSSTLS